MLYKTVDDWNYKYIDQINLKRFLIKCGIIPNDNLLISIIRRMDLDADAKLNLKEFIDAVRPVENFTAKKVIKSEPKMPKSREYTICKWILGNGKECGKTYANSGNLKKHMKIHEIP